MGYKDKSVPGEYPECGAIFMSNSGTKRECLRRKLFGLPSNMSDFVLHVKKGMTLFLFEFERRLLYGVYRATSDGEINIEHKAFRSSGKNFPAQVRFTSVWDCSPLAEHEFRDAIWDNYFSGKKFKFGLNKDQVSKLMMLFRSKKILKNHPERNIPRCRDKPAAEGDARFGDLRKDIRNRLRVVCKEDCNRVDVHEKLNEKILEVDDLSCRGGSGNKRDRFLTNYLTQNNEFADCHSRQGNHLDHSLGESRRVADADLRIMDDVDSMHEISNPKSVREISNKESFYREKIKAENDFEDGYIPIFTQPHGSNDGKFLVDGRNKMDYNRVKDAYDVREGSCQHLSPHNPHSPFDRGSRAFKDEYFVAHEAVKREQTTLNEHEHPLFISRRTSFEMQPDDDEKFGFGSVAPTTYASIRASDLTNSLPFSHFNQNSYLKSCNPPKIEVPDIRDSPSYFASGSSFIPLDNSPFYTCSEEIPTVLPLSKTFSYDPHDEGSIRYYDDLAYASSNKSQETFKGNRVFKISSQEGSPSAVFPDFISRKLFPSDVGICVHEEQSFDSDKSFFQPREGMHHDDSGKRVSVFSRLTSDLRHEQEFETYEKRELDASVNKVMKALEKVVSSPIKRTGKSKSALKQDDSDIVDDELPIVKIEANVELEDEEIEGGSPLVETRLVDFNRRKKSRKSIYDLSNENSKSCIGAMSDVGPCKRRKLVRPAFVENESTADGIIALNTNMQSTSCENTPEDDSISTKTVLERSGEVDASNKFIDLNVLPVSHEKTPIRNDTISTIVVPQISENVDATITAVDVNMLSTSHENTPSDDDNLSTKAVLKSSEKAEVSIKFMDLNMLPTSYENTPFTNGSISTIAVAEISVNVDAASKTMDVNMLPTSYENTPLTDASISTIAVPEISENVDAAIKTMDVTMLPTSLENSPSYDDCIATKSVPGNTEMIDASIKLLQVPAEDRNAENNSMAGVFVERNQVASSKDYSKMCGWIEW